jgi:ABC-type lipoprotein export system ATPase subunit
MLSLLHQLIDREGVTILVTSHDPIIDDYAQEIFLLKDGNFEISATTYKLD